MSTASAKVDQVKEEMEDCENRMMQARVANSSLSKISTNLLEIHRTVNTID